MASTSAHQASHASDQPMSPVANPAEPFVFVEGFEPAYYERTIRSYLARKAWREKRSEQIRQYQMSSPPSPVAPAHPGLAFRNPSGKLAEAQVGARNLVRSTESRGSPMPSYCRLNQPAWQLTRRLRKGSPIHCWPPRSVN
jgi:hypothetical protein